MNWFPKRVLERAAGKKPGGRIFGDRWFGVEEGQNIRPGGPSQFPRGILSGKRRQ